MLFRMSTLPHTAATKRQQMMVKKKIFVFTFSFCCYGKWGLWRGRKKKFADQNSIKAIVMKSTIASMNINMYTNWMLYSNDRIHEYFIRWPNFFSIFSIGSFFFVVSCHTYLIVCLSFSMFSFISRQKWTKNFYIQKIWSRHITTAIQPLSNDVLFFFSSLLFSATFWI